MAMMLSLRSRTARQVRIRDLRTRRQVDARPDAGGRVTDAAGVERTTRHARAAPVRLGSIQALNSRRRGAGNGSLRPPPRPSPCPPRPDGAALRAWGARG